MGLYELSPSAPPSAVTAPPSFPGAAPAPRPPRWRVVRRQALFVVLAGAVAGLAAFGAMRFVDPVYASAASVRVEVKEARLPDVYQRVVTGSEVGNEVDLLRSRTLAERVVDSLGLRVQLVRPAAGRATLFASVRATRGADTGTFAFRRAGDGFAVFTGAPARQVGVARAGAPVALPGATLVLAPAALAEPELEVRVDEFDEAVGALADELSIERAGRESQVIAVGYSSPDPTLARDVPNVTVARFLAMRRRGRQGEASSTAAALREQIRTLSQELATSDATLRRFRERGRVVDPKQEGSTQIARLAALRTDRTRLGAERDALAALMAALAARAGGERGAELPYRQIGGFPGLRDNEAVGSYVRALTAVEEQRAALLVRRTPEDPDVVALTDRARTLEQQLRGTAAAYLDGITRQTAAMDAELARTEQQLARLPGQEAEYARLERGPKVLGEMLTLLQTRLKEAEIAEAVQDPTVQLLDAAPLPKRAVRPRPSRDVPLAAFGGLLLGLAGVLVRERLDRTVRTRDDVQAWARLPVLGVIPRGGSGRGAPPMLVGGAAGGRRSLPGGGGRGRRDAIDPMLLEAFARLQARVAFAHAGERPRTVVITSPLSGEGKTSTAGNLARAVAHTGSHTLLIDADLPRGTLHKRFGLARAPGMAELLAGAAAFDDVVHRVDVGGGVTLAVIPAGEPVGPERRLLTSERVGEVLALAAARFDSVLVDAPPLNLTADATVLAGAADAVLLVARAGQTPLDALAHAAQHLEGTRATTLGVVVNDVDPVRDAAYDAEYRYYADPYLHTGEAR